jgi:DNA-binding NtrC family response regulator
MSRILAVDDDQGILNIVSSLLKTEGHEVSTAADTNTAMNMIRKQPYELVITDLRIQPMNGIQFLKLVRKDFPSLPVLIITAFATIESAAEAMRAGVFDLITKPFKIPDFLATVNHALDYHRAETTGLQKLVKADCRFGVIVAESVAMKKLCDQIEWIAPTNAPAFILGEPGSQKETIAKVIHDQRGLKSHRFHTFDCASALPEQAELELFGLDLRSENTYPRPGLLEQSDQGTLYLDHIGNLDLDTQKKILDVLNTKKVSRLGQTETRTITLKLIVGSNVPLEPLIEQGEFLEELYRKFSSVTLRIPPLKERVADIIPLAYHAIRAEFGLDADLISIEPDAAAILEKYSWPGNEAELEKVVLAALRASKGKPISKAFLPQEIVAAAKHAPQAASPSNNAADHRWTFLRAYLNSAEKEYVRSVYDMMNGDAHKAARALRISVADLLKRLEP